MVLALPFSNRGRSVLDTRATPLPAEAPAASTDTGGPEQVGSARLGAFAFAAYLVVSFLFYGVRILGSFSTSFAGEGAGDAKIYLWDMRWWPYALTHHLNPFIASVIYVPKGIDMAWATGLPGPALVMWPVTQLFGALVTTNVLTILSPALAGWAAYLLSRRLVAGRFWPAFVGGYLFGFSSYEIAQVRGHVNLFLVFPVPLAVYLVVRYMQGSMGGRAFVALLALTLIGEFSISTEIFVSMTFFGGMALAIVWWRDKEIRHRLNGAIGRMGAAYLAAVVVLAPYFYYILKSFPAGPLKPVAEGSSSVDLAGFVMPRVATLIGGQAFHHLTAAFKTNNSEDSAYLSIALVVVLVIAIYERRRHDGVLRLAAAFAAIASVAALGAWLHVDGHRLFPMPWLPFTAVPGLQDALPQRFTLYAWLAIAVVVARWLAATASGRSIADTTARYGLVVIACILLIPNVFEPKPAEPTTPPFFTQGIYRHEIPQGATVLLIHPAKGLDMQWQEETGFWFSMAQGHIGTEPASYRDHPAWSAIRNDNPGAVSSQDFRGFVLVHGVTEIVVDDVVAQKWAATLESALHVEPVHIGGVAIYRPPAGRSSF
jgi:hypothetical protein